MRMQRNDRSQPRAIDLAAALGLLTRLPVPIDGERAAARGAASAWAWPVAGALVGALAALAGFAALGLGLTPGVAAAIVLGCQTMMTGAMHEDGLADTADGLWGGWDRARRLEIMKDSSIGTYGVMALLVVTLLRWSALATLLAQGVPWAVLIATGALSRAPMAVIMAALPNARGTGLSQSVGRPQAITAGLAVAVALGIAGLCLGPGALGMLAVVVPVSLALAVVALRRIGGQTGDILGASQQLAEAALLALAAARA
jgi:adenosylcobinamide-GDP ribazoletransferase